MYMKNVRRKEFCNYRENMCKAHNLVDDKHTEKGNLYSRFATKMT